MNVYVSGSIHDREMIRMLQDAVRLRGHGITHDWTTFPDVVEEGVNKMARARQREEAERQVAAVIAADVVVVVWNTMRSHTGTLIEVGAALASGTNVLVIEDRAHQVNGESPKTLFSAHPNYQVVRTPSEALGALGYVE